MRLAFSTLACPGWPLERVVDAAVRYGYDGVELRLIGDETIGPDLPVDERRRVAATFSTAETPIIAVDSSLRLVDGESEDVVSFMELARSWNCGVIRVFGGQLADDTEIRRSQLAVARSVLTDAAKVAERLGVRVGVETHDALSDATLLAELLASVPSEWVGAVWDAHHPHRIGQDPATVLNALGDRLILVQVKDARHSGVHSDSWELVPLGEGDVPVRSMLRLLRDTGYEGWLSVEWEKKWHPDIEPAEVALPQHIGILRKWLHEP